MACDAILSERRRRDRAHGSPVRRTGAGMLRSLAPGRGPRRRVRRRAVLREDTAPEGDGTLVARLRAGDGAAYGTLRQYGGRMLSTARRFVRSRRTGPGRRPGGVHRRVQIHRWFQRSLPPVDVAASHRRQRGADEAAHEAPPPGRLHRRRCRPSGTTVAGRARPPDWETPADALFEQCETRSRVRAAIDQLPGDLIAPCSCCATSGARHRRRPPRRSASRPTR